MSKTEFEPKDFNSFAVWTPEELVTKANKLLPEIKEAWKAEMLKDAVVVYQHNADDKSVWFSLDNNIGKATHKALLIDIKPIVKECVKHDADLFGTRKYENSFPCIHCGVELVADGRRSRIK